MREASVELVCRAIRCHRQHRGLVRHALTLLGNLNRTHAQITENILHKGKRG